MSNTKDAFTVNKREVNELLKDPQWSKDQDLSEKVKLARCEVYVHSNGRVLNLFAGGSGQLYSTREAFLPLAEQVAAMRLDMTQHILEGRLPQGKNFIEHVPQLVDNMALLLHMTQAELDDSETSLDIVDRKVKHLGRKKCLEIPVFPALVAYVGEVMRKATNGKWEMRLNHDSATWEPWIIDPQGRSCNPFALIYEQLSEQYPFSIRGATSGTIESRFVTSKGQPRRVSHYLPNSDLNDQS